MILKTTPALDITLKKACQDAGVDDPAELIRRAISLYAMVAENRLLGRCLLMQDIDGTLHEIMVL